MAAQFLVSSRFQGQFVVRLREGLGVQMHPKSWHCQKGGGRGSATFQDFLEDLSTSEKPSAKCSLKKTKNKECTKMFIA